MTSQNPITSETEAIKRASVLTELHGSAKRITAQPVTVKDDWTPFLWKQFNGRPAWQIEFDEVSLKLKSALPSFPDRNLRKFIVLVDQETGQLLGVRSTFEGKDPDLREMPAAVDAEEQLRAEEEIYHGLPTEGPRLSFLGSLDAVLTKGIGSPLVAKEIYGSYVLHSRRGSPQLAVWVVTLRGLPPIPAHGPYADTVPIWQRNHMRNVIDDATGECLFATNSPQPK